jgi:hypothetical protein
LQVQEPLTAAIMLTSMTSLPLKLLSLVRKS